MNADRFEDHAWADVVPEDLLAIYAPYQRETFVGPRPALILIDLYNVAYRGGPVQPETLLGQYYPALAASTPTMRSSPPSG